MNNTNRISNIKQRIANNEVCQVGRVLTSSLLFLPLFFAFLCVLSGAKIHAQTLTDTLSLDHLLELTAMHTIQEKEAAQNVWVAEANLASLEASLKPQLSYLVTSQTFREP